MDAVSTPTSTHMSLNALFGGEVKGQGKGASDDSITRNQIGGPQLTFTRVFTTVSMRC
jgi:hypothetical protein